MSCKVLSLCLITTLIIEADIGIYNEADQFYDTKFCNLDTAKAFLKFS